MSDERDTLVPPVEPLPDLTWARLERQLWQALDAPPPRTVADAPPRLARWRWPMIAAGAIAAAAAIALVWPRGSHAPLTAGAREGSAIATPSRIATAGAATELSFGDADIELAPQSTLFLGGDDRRGVDLLLERGRARFEVAHRDGRPPFIVRAGAVRITVVGTGFTVVRDGDSAQVEVTHGVVEVVAAGHRDRLVAGQLWDHGLVRTGELAVRSDVPTMVATAPAPVAPAPAAADAPATDAPTTAPTHDAPPVIAPRPPGVTASPRHAPTGPTATDPKAAFAAAAALEASAPARALAAYLDLADGASSWAAPALYAAARLAFDRGDAARARTLSARYLRSFPGGRNALDARALLERLATPSTE
ncbi:MAG: FecR domain-containing protein [Myxococcales bacterium]|nr:FecR domain-containing protein [Myxococcales bacterium]